MTNIASPCSKTSYGVLKQQPVKNMVSYHQQPIGADKHTYRNLYILVLQMLVFTMKYNCSTLDIHFGNNFDYAVKWKLLVTVNTLTSELLFLSLTVAQFLLRKNFK